MMFVVLGVLVMPVISVKYLLTTYVLPHLITAAPSQPFDGFFQAGICIGIDMV